MTKTIIPSEVIETYLDESNWRVNENASVGYSVSGLIMHAAGTIMANYTLDSIYPKEISNAHRSGAFHTHDLSFGIAPYCCGHDLMILLQEGFNGVPNKVACAPPKHLSTAVSQMVNMLGCAQIEAAGAQAFSSVDTLLAPYVRKDNLTFEQTKQQIQQLVFGLNVSSRWGSQAVFSNITLDLTPPKDLANTQVVIANVLEEYTYADLQKEMDMINKALLEVYLGGDYDGRPFAYPIPTYNITKDFLWESEVADLLMQVASRYGLPYFALYENSDMNPEDSRSMCCRLRLDKRELLSRGGGGLFGSGSRTGSIGVVTINMPRIGYLTENREEFLAELDYLLELAKSSLEIKRKIINKSLDSSLLPYTKRYIGSFDTFFSTIGLVGMHEMCLNFLGVGIETDKGRTFSLEILEYMRERIGDFQEETGNLYNLEATPAESTCYRLAQKDKELYPDIITAGETDVYYTNSSHLPVNHGKDLIRALKHQDELQCKYTGGTVHHIYLGESPDVETCKVLIKKISKQFRMPYISITPTYSICPEHGYIAGEHFICPTCNREAEVYSRITGYYRPIQNWNEGKRSEFVDRVEYHIEDNA